VRFFAIYDSRGRMS